MTDLAKQRLKLKLAEKDYKLFVENIDLVFETCVENLFFIGEHTLNILKIYLQANSVQLTET